jgi:SAM-dependent methyltransferase
MTKAEDEAILRSTNYWHYHFELPWGSMAATKPGHNERQIARREHFFRPLLEVYGGSLSNKRVLDLGCAQGFWSFEASKAGAMETLGIDSSSDFIREAWALSTLLDLHNCEFRCEHLEEDPWWSNLAPFHVTLFLGLFYHLADPLFVLTKATKATLEIIVLDTEITSGKESTLTIRQRDLQEPTTCGSNIKSKIRLVPSKLALQDLLQEAGFSKIQFLAPHPLLPQEYHVGKRISVIAQR